jgi:hypothetical protein
MSFALCSGSRYNPCGMSPEKQALRGDICGITSYPTAAVDSARANAQREKISADACAQLI